MPAAVSSEPFRALVTALREGGFVHHAGRLEDALNGTWTTSSELVAELGGAVLVIRKECKPATDEQKALLKKCLREVRKVWPGFGWFRWFSWP